LALPFIACPGYNVFTLLEKELKMIISPGLSANAWLRGWTYPSGASSNSIIAEAPVTPVSSREAGAIRMFPVGVNARFT